MSDPVPIQLDENVEILMKAINSYQPEFPIILTKKMLSENGIQTKDENAIKLISLVSEMMLENIISSITHIKDDEKSRSKKKKTDETLLTKQVMQELQSQGLQFDDIIQYPNVKQMDNNIEEK